MKMLVTSNGLPLHLYNKRPRRLSTLPTIAWMEERSQPQNNPAKRKSLKLYAKGFAGMRPTKTLEEEEDAINKGRESQTDDQDEQIPREVFSRMMVRIVLSVVVPMGIGLVLMYIFGVIRDQHLWDVPKWLPYLTTFLAFLASTLGIPYGALSTPWDVNKKGSFLGFEEIQQNWNEMWEEEDAEERAQK